jgi:hypothetical protein
MRRLTLLSAALLAACSPVASDTAASAESGASVNSSTPRADARHPIVVELYQSQGCSSCPPANAALNDVAGKPGVLALSFAVTYWDQLGWKDRFARPIFTTRQWDYARAGRRERVFTPQIIVNGGPMMVGGDRAHFDRLIRDSGPLANGPSIDVAGGRVTIGIGKTPAPATVWLVRYDPRVRNVAIRAGENGGKTLPHKNIVTDLTALGTWTGKAAQFTAAASPDAALRSAVLLQRGTGGPLVAARIL